MTVELLTDGPLVSILIVAALIVVIFRRPMKWLLRLLGRSALWLGFLAILSESGLALIGVNCVNALTLGFLGMPGLGLLLLLRWLGT